MEKFVVELANDESLTPRQRSDLLEGIWRESTDEKERAELDRLLEQVRDQIDDSKQRPKLGWIEES